MITFKTIHFHAKGTFTAATHGHGRTGCYTVETRSTGQPLRVAQAFTDPFLAQLCLERTPGTLCPHYVALAHGQVAPRSGPSWLND